MDKLRDILRKYWGYDSFRPLQAEAMNSVLAGRDSVVVLPTGGGKSLCFQAPALALDGLAVVVSPLISLMKDQVDGLIDSGVPAACVNSSLSAEERRQVAEDVRAGRLKLLYLSPEKLMTERTLEFLREARVSFFAIDEAHCVSDWGHDFRPEYRMLSRLKATFPGVAVHAYTATATERVRQDIVCELGLERAEILVGSFDRPNLLYRVQRRTDLLAQVREVIDRHPNDSGIIYCIRRADVDDLSATLRDAGLQALPYHAGLDDATRRKNQDDFINDRARIIVATVAFGMGIDKSDVRYVVHAGGPKSIEHYQQESGRAGRDGLEAECVLLYSGADFATWRKLQSELPPAAYEIALTMLAGIEGYCGAANCRHRALVEYFAQEFAVASCGACDVCLNEIEFVADSLIIGQKILSCVARLNQAFGGDYTALVLTGSREQRIVENGHDKLSTHGLLAEAGKKSVRDWIDQLVNLGFLQRTGEYNILGITAEGRRLLRGEIIPRLLKPAESKSRRAEPAAASWEGVDRELFEQLRSWRRTRSAERGLPPFMILSDATLRNLAKCRPSTITRLREVNGISERKASEYGEELLQTITDYCREADLAQDAFDTPSTSDTTKSRPDKESNSRSPASSGSAAKHRALQLLLQGQSIDAVASAVERAHSTVTQYLIELIGTEQISDPSAWLDPATFERIRLAVSRLGPTPLKPLFETFNSEIPYDQLRIALACLRHAPPETQATAPTGSVNLPAS